MVFSDLFLINKVDYFTHSLNISLTKLATRGTIGLNTVPGIMMEFDPLLHEMPLLRETDPPEICPFYICP